VDSDIVSPGLCNVSLAYERIDIETGRWIVSSMAVVAEVDEIKFKEMFPNEP